MANAENPLPWNLYKSQERSHQVGNMPSEVTLRRSEQPLGLKICGDFFVFPGVVLEIQKQKGPQGRQAECYQGNKGIT